MNHTLNQAVIDKIQPDYQYQPLAVFLIGANGSGKSSLRKYIDLSDIQTNIDPDALNKITRLKQGKDDVIYASKQALLMYRYALENKLNVCLESTLAGKGTINRIYQAKSQGYYIVAYFMGLGSVDLNIERVKKRVLAGGHDIPENLIIKRYQESCDNLIKVTKAIDQLHVIDNSQPYFALQFSRFNQQYIVHQDKQIKWAERLFQTLLQQR
ncbi:zeta toxin family protein [Facilibium subflavum]|uniref:zeta toxin family protein n=1 Tax=Facilibium subflavum TaxID=2219058 RepID=UPI000E646FFC|nr:zeta toxin family protein [Facilibium subflavum]